MKSGIQTTFIMGIIAVAASMAAAWYYPWPVPDTSAEMVGKDLFEKYDSEQVSWIEMVRFNRDSGDAETIRLRKRNDKWIIPSRSNFEANAAGRIAASTVALNNLMISEVKEDTQSAHVIYGVVDPSDDQSTTRSGLGTKLTLEDRDNQTIASLIIGNEVAGSDKHQHYVRIPGQTTVYVIEFEHGILSTEFSDWISSNLAQLGGPGQRLIGVNVNNYRINADQLGSDTPPTMLYRAGFDMRNMQQPGLVVEALPGPDMEMGSVMAVTADAPEAVREAEAQRNALLAGWASPGGSGTGNPLVSDLKLIDVIPKDGELTKLLRAPDPAAANEIFDSMHIFGFRKSGFGKNNYLFESVRGSVQLSSSEGVLTNILIGSLAGAATDGSGRLTRYMILTADIDPDAYPEIEKPENADEDRIYLLAVEERQKRLDFATQTARDLNRSFAGWYYVIDEGSAETLIPAVEFPPELIQPLEAADTPAVDSTTDENKPSESAEDSNPAEEAPATNEGDQDSANEDSQDEAPADEPAETDDDSSSGGDGSTY